MILFIYVAAVTSPRFLTLYTTAAIIFWIKSGLANIPSINFGALYFNANIDILLNKDFIISNLIFNSTSEWPYENWPIIFLMYSKLISDS